MARPLSFGRPGAGQPTKRYGKPEQFGKKAEKPGPALRRINKPQAGRFNGKPESSDIKREALAKYQKGMK